MTPPSSLAGLISNFRTKRILVVGDVMIDRYVFGRVERLNPEAPVPILHAKRTQDATGGAGNTAKNAASLGAVTTLVSVTGVDVSGRDLFAIAKGEGYDAVLIADPSRPTIEKKRYIVGSQQMLRVDFEETHPIGSRVEDAVARAIDSAAAACDAIIVSDYAKGTITPRVADALLRASRDRGVPLMADIKPSNIQLFRGASYLSPNRKEAHEYLGLNQHLQGGRPREELARRLRETFSAGIFLTLSEEGMYVLTGDTPGVHVPQAHRIEVADTSGCGDTAAVAITLAKVCGASDVEAALVGNAAGAVIATRIGAVALKPEDLAAMLSNGAV